MTGIGFVGVDLLDSDTGEMDGRERSSNKGVGSLIKYNSELADNVDFLLYFFNTILRYI